MPSAIQNFRRTQHLFTSESVTMGHPDKVADQISDAVLDALLAQDPRSRVAVETLVTTGQVVLAGEVTTRLTSMPPRSPATPSARSATPIPISASTSIVAACLPPSTANPPISPAASTAPRTTARSKAPATRASCSATPATKPPNSCLCPIHLAHRLVERLAEMREKQKLSWLRPDGKSQVTVEYRNEQPTRVHTVVVSTQHDESVIDKKHDCISEKAKKQIIEQVIKPVIPKKLWNDDIVFHINPTGKFVVGGPHGDTGLTGRKIIVDSYGGRGAHGGGAFSGKDPSKVDRSACYMGRYIAKNIVAAGLARCAEVQLAYAIGVAHPVSVTVSTEGTAVIPEDQIAELIKDHFPLTPRGIIRHLDLLRPIYKQTARHGHFGRIPGRDGAFSWEKTDKAADLAKAAGLTVRKAG